MPDPDHPADRRADGLAVLLGAAFSLGVGGYSFGEGNHHIYLLDALRALDPAALANDWFTTRTLQYHVLFTHLTAGLMRLRLLESGFLAGHVLTAAGLHAGWLGIARAVGGTRGTYLLSVVLYHGSFGGFAPGFYQFLQDGCFLPSNVAAAALLLGLWAWVIGRPIWAGAGFGVAGAFHLNYAVVGVGLWAGLVTIEVLRRSRRTVAGDGPARWVRRVVVASVPATLPGVFNVGHALRLKLERSGSMPLDEFVRLYVELRHPHHYDPSSWPWLLWASFLWPVPLAVWAWRRSLRSRERRAAARRTGDVVLLISGLLLVSLLGAGAWYVSETLVQMSLWRFAVYVKLLTCVGAAGAILPHLRRAGAVAGWSAFVVAAVGIAGAAHVARDRFGPDRRDAAFAEVSARVRRSTPADAVILVPPQHSSMQWDGRRAVVTAYKQVPQLGGELPEWRDRLEAVLGLDDLAALPRPMPATLAAVAELYRDRSAADLFAVARRYGARYVVAAARLDDAAAHGGREECRTRGGEYFLYDLGPTTTEPRRRDDARP